jgi:predicted HTH domain antitoxin
MQNLIIPAGVLEALKADKKTLLTDLAVYLYKKEELSMGQAKRLVGMSVLEFQHALAQRGKHIYYNISNYEEDLKTIEKMKLHDHHQ